MAKLKPEFDKRNTKIIGLSVDPVDDTRNGRRTSRTRRARAELSDDRRYRPGGVQAVRHAAGQSSRHVRRPHRRRQQTVRNVFVIGPDKKVKLIIVYPMTTGRNFDESAAGDRFVAAHGRNTRWQRR
jgi:alkyl hydroperoxide reductase subunit AhpC